MKPKIILIILVCTALSTGGILLARNLPLRHSVVISLPLATVNKKVQQPVRQHQFRNINIWAKI